MVNQGSMQASAGLQRCFTWLQVAYGLILGTLPYWRVPMSIMHELQQVELSPSPSNRTCIHPWPALRLSRIKETDHLKSVYRSGWERVPPLHYPTARRSSNLPTPHSNDNTTSNEVQDIVWISIFSRQILPTYPDGHKSRSNEIGISGKETN